MDQLDMSQNTIQIYGKQLENPSFWDIEKQKRGCTKNVYTEWNTKVTQLIQAMHTCSHVFPLSTLNLTGSKPKLFD